MATRVNVKKKSVWVNTDEIFANIRGESSGVALISLSLSLLHANTDNADLTSTVMQSYLHTQVCVVLITQG